MVKTIESLNKIILVCIIRLKSRQVKKIKTKLRKQESKLYDLLDEYQKRYIY